MPSYETGYTGGLVENEMLGTAQLERGKHARAQIEYQPYQQAIKTVREGQPGDPSDPEARFANDLHATIAEILKLENYSQLKFFTAVGSTLDRFHGVDGFFELQADPSSSESTIIVTLDITMNPQKGDQYKADHIIEIPTDGLDPKEDKEAFTALVKTTAQQIVKLLEAQLVVVA
ncbi:hypothetical protein KKB10_00045 [Patescibacteria group bacterium]|nr:hypothetical protein [Patescibacteria group bacterium]MBU1951537.1 hypothetical protein [Patescibacteria group bacterium]